MRLFIVRIAIAAFFLLSIRALASAQTNGEGRTYGPFNVSLIASGLGWKRDLPRVISVAPNSPWSMSCWVKSDEPPAHTLIGGIGESSPNSSPRYFAIEDGKLTLWLSRNGSILSNDGLSPGKWTYLTVTYDGEEARLFKDGQEVGTREVSLGALRPSVQLGPDKLPWPDGEHFGGEIANFKFATGAMSNDEVKSNYSQPPRFDLIEFDAASKGWPVQTRAQAGYRSPQDPSTLPQSRVPLQTPVAKANDNAEPRLDERGPNTWALRGGWTMAAAPDVNAKGDLISTPGYSGKGWLSATVPGTALTTYINRGVYPDPDYGLNNLAIPEKLNRQDYWYRTEFTPTSSLKGRHLSLTFNGINYAAQVWVNGNSVGSIKGAFIRGQFDVTSLVEPGKENVVAVRISPPPHPGIPQEQSITAGPGENGGLLCLDGPTFVATEGWDWIPGIRDRNTGIWQDVTLKATDSVKIQDPQVVTKLHLPRTDHADVSIAVPLFNDSNTAVKGTLTASFEGVKLSKSVSAVPGQSMVTLTPVEFRQLSIDNPRLWWPNGYGRPELYHLNLSFETSAGESDLKSVRFGIREITYELSALDHTGHLQRVEFAPTAAGGVTVIDTRHEGMIQSTTGWVASLQPGAETSTAIRSIRDTSSAPYLVIKVNGVRIACKGGNWGMDDSRKRVSREHLEPFFRLHRDANLNIIRNWVGQNTEEVFYDLADEYGLLVWNDFWDSTQNYNVEPDDSALFLANAKDVILRFRNHPSIVLWCGRNEGVPAPAVNVGLDELVRELDGTRYYSPSSNQINLQNSGPYKYNRPADYFTKFARGFSVELGIPSMPTIDAFKAFVPEPDRWPPNDTWAYHDWHASGNGLTSPFMSALADEFGEGKSLEDFEKKAQMLNYVTHRAIFEGFNAHLWNPNSGRMLWMTQPAWPSTMWQILSSDYDTQASYYGVKKASEPVHVQMNLPDLTTAVVNTTTVPLKNVVLSARVFSTDTKVLLSHKRQMSVEPGREADGFQLELPGESANDVVFIKLELHDEDGRLLSENFYWQASQEQIYKRLDHLPTVSVRASAAETQMRDVTRVSVRLSNPGRTFAIMNKITLRNASDETRILPAYLSDNYISLLPGETRNVTIEAPSSAVKGALSVGITGWNVEAKSFPVGHTERF